MSRATIWVPYLSTAGGGEAELLATADACRSLGLEVLLAGLDPLSSSGISNILGRELEHDSYLQIRDKGSLYSIAKNSDLFINGEYGGRMFAPDCPSIFICHFIDPKSLKIKSSSGLLANRTLGFLNDGIPIVSSRGKPALISTPSFYTISEQGRLKISNRGGALKLVFNGSLAILGPGQSREFEGAGNLRVIGSPTLSFQVEGLSDIRFMDYRQLQKPTNLFAHSFSSIWANSSFSHHWMAKRWGVEAKLVSPPVETEISTQVLAKKPHQILSVGRFFDPKDGHSKNQLLLVKAFRDLTRKSELPWHLHLVGGVSPEQSRYFEKVKKAASGLNVTIHANAPKELLSGLYDTSTYFWHGSGIGQSMRQPWKFEHFGIAPLEAMAHGVIPIVYFKGGPKEVLDNFPQLQFSSLSMLSKIQLELGSGKLEISTDLVRREAKNYSAEIFNTRALKLIRPLIEPFEE